MFVFVYNLINVNMVKTVIVIDIYGKYSYFIRNKRNGHFKPTFISTTKSLMPWRYTYL